MLINVALWCPSQPKLTGILRYAAVILFSKFIGAIDRRLELLVMTYFV